MDSQVTTANAFINQKVNIPKNNQCFLTFTLSQPMSDDSWLIDIVDSEWRNEKLPSEDIQVPIENSIDPENAENEGNSNKDQVGGRSP